MKRYGLCATRGWKHLSLVVLLAPGLLLSVVQAASIDLIVDDASPQTVFAASEVQTAFRERRHAVQRSALDRLGHVSSNALVVLLSRTHHPGLDAMRAAPRRFAHARRKGHHAGPIVPPKDLRPLTRAAVPAPCLRLRRFAA